jgi:taurine dioxygenase
VGWRALIGALGAERDDLDVRHADPQAIMAALAEHKLLVLRDQKLTPATFTAAAERLGELDVYPFAEPIEGHPHVVRVLKEPGDTANFGGAWHSDTAYLPEPPAATLLLAVEVPDTGGDTLFADSVAAFDRCSAGFQTFLRRLTGHNTSGLVHQAQGPYASVAGQSVAARGSNQVTEADHPLVIADEHGREALYFSLIHTSHFVGLTRRESLPLLEQLHALTVAPENVTRLKWRPGTLAIWDNRAVQHYPLNDYPGRRREMHRIILRGGRPAGRAPAQG